MTQSSRFKLSIFTAVVLTIVGVIAFIYDPVNIDKFAIYMLNTVIPVVGYIIGRTIRSGKHYSGLMSKSTRFKTSFYTFIISVIIGIGCYVLEPEYIDKLGLYMLTVILPIVGYILGRSFKGEHSSSDSNLTQDQ